MPRIKKINFKVTLRTAILFFLTVFFTQVKAQDTIVKRNGTKIIIKIVEVSSTEIKYKFLDYQEGPLFVIPKWELNSVTYGNGTKELFDSIKPPAQPLISSTKKDLTMMRAGKYYLFQTHKINELDMLSIAQNVNDKKLNFIIKRTREIRFVRKGFSTAAIVLGSFGLLTYIGVIPINSQASATSGGGRYGGRRARSANTAYRHTLGGDFMLVALGCEAVSLVIRIDEIKHAHLVLKVYNKIVGN